MKSWILALGVIAVFALLIQVEGYRFMPSVGVPGNVVGATAVACEGGRVVAVIRYRDRAAVYTNGDQFQVQRPVAVGLFKNSALYVRTLVPFIAVVYRLPDDDERLKMALPTGLCSLRYGPAVPPATKPITF